MKIILGTLIFIVDKEKVLLIKREKPPYTGYWGMPGGKIDFGEHPEETSVREAKEETGLDTEFVKIRGVISEIIKDKQTNEKLDHFIMFVSELKPKNFDLIQSDEGEFKWFDFSELEKIKIIPSEVKIIREIAMKDDFIEVHKSHVSKKEEEYFLEMFSK